MAYSRIKVWIAAEILTASDLNAEHTGHIANENDLDTRLVAEIAARTTLEGEHDTLQTNLWNATDGQVADNRVGQDSMKDDAIHTAELKTGAVTEVKCAAAIKDAAVGVYSLRRLGTTSLKACAGNDSRFGVPNDASVSQAKLKTSTQTQSYDLVAGGTWKFTLTGGQYCFKVTHKGEDAASVFFGATTYCTTSYATHAAFKNTHASENRYAYCQHRYVTSSGEINWFFILRNKITKTIIGRSIAPDHPCFGNGGKPLLIPHPFGQYDDTKYEIIVINPTNKEIEQMEMETIINDETKPDKDLLEVITENYEIDEASNPAWPTKAVTVGLPKYIKDKKGKKVLADYRFMGKDDVVEPIKKVIPKPNYIKVKTLKKRSL